MIDHFLVNAMGNVARGNFLVIRKIYFGALESQFGVQQVRLAMVPRNSQLILFETSIQHQEFLMIKT